MKVILSLPGDRERERDSELDSDWGLTQGERKDSVRNVLKTQQRNKSDFFLRIFPLLNFWISFEFLRPFIYWALTF